MIAYLAMLSMLLIHPFQNYHMAFYVILRSLLRHFSFETVTTMEQTLPESRIVQLLCSCKDHSDPTENRDYFWGAKGAPILFSVLGYCLASCS